ncbi:hypothetical protein [Sessilibacter sp. MAH2]
MKKLIFRTFLLGFMLSAMANLSLAQSLDEENAADDGDLHPNRITIIANKDVDTESLSTVDVRSIFAMRQRVWPSGETIKVFVFSDNNPTHVRFTKQILNTFPYNLRRIWDRRVFSGIGQYPTRLNTEQEMIDAIANTTNAIGYIQHEYLTDEVKVLVVNND